MFSSESVEARLCTLVFQIADLHESPDPADNMFELGMDSLSLVDLKERIKSELGVDVRFSDFFTYFTIRDLAAAVILLSTNKGKK